MLSLIWTLEHSKLSCCLGIKWDNFFFIREIVGLLDRALILWSTISLSYISHYLINGTANWVPTRCLDGLPRFFISVIGFSLLCLPFDLFVLDII